MGCPLGEAPKINEEQLRKRLSLALYNQFEHPDSTEVGGPDWEDVKEIYAEARASVVLWGYLYNHRMGSCPGAADPF